MSIRICLLCLLFVAGLRVAPCQKVKDDVFLFSYFKNNGEDGLHLAYSYDGYKWHILNGDSAFLKPAVGNDKLMRDPCIVKDKHGTYHMVWTVSWNERGVGYASSNDLIHWSTQQYIPVMEHDTRARNCWAPEIFFNAEKDEFMIYWATTLKGKYPETQSEKENGYNHRIYYVTTKDFVNFTEASLLYEQKFNVIDATIINENGRFIMFLKDETPEPPQKNIRIAESKKLTHGYGKPGKPITGSYWAEGPTVVRTEKDWIVYFDKYTEKKMGAVISSNLKTWSDISEKISFPDGVRHGTVLKISKEELEALKRF